jgi:ubiquinone/menaquinone biosynthesis C-methylase UbiE
MKFSKFFSRLQEAPWYRSFLKPVIKETGMEGRLLDIGTGSGKLIQILSTENGLDCAGVDTDSEMLAEAKIKLGNINAELVEITPNEKLPFENNSFDYITICSVLFHLNKQDMDNMLNDARRLLREEGKIIMLTPTGSGGILKLTKDFFSIKNRSIYIWYHATKKRARIWTKENFIAEYASKHKLSYKREVVMNGFAQLEIIKA